MIHYIPEPLLDIIFEFVRERYARVEEVPQYKGETRFKEFCGILEQVQSVYYLTLLDKAVFLLVSINKGHFFSNGNKRLALTIMTVFLALNNTYFKADITKGIYKIILAKQFPEYSEWDDFEDFSPTDFATYNLSIMIAESGRYQLSHDALKERVRVFLSEVVETVNG